MIETPNSGHDDRRELFEPGAVDRALRDVIGMCWMTFPVGKPTIDSVEKEMRRLLDRAIRDMREDERHANEAQT